VSSPACCVCIWSPGWWKGWTKRILTLRVSLSENTDTCEDRWRLWRLAGYSNFAHEYEMPAFCRLWSCDPIVGWLYMVVFSLVNGYHWEYNHPSSPEKQTHEIDRLHKDSGMSNTWQCGNGSPLELHTWFGPLKRGWNPDQLETKSSCLSLLSTNFL
jgi:hypothetical protein